MYASIESRGRVEREGSTYQSEGFRRELGLLEERDGNLACDDTEICCIGSLEELVEDSFLLSG
jgi:hypothetical protein